ncbi:MAG: hypothetical protein AMXMBFR64_08170 [Myxococcales bacterium]
MRMFNRFAMSLLVASTLVATASIARADCKPKCPEGQVCRYEAAGGTFYCADPPTKGGGGGVKGTPTSPGGIKPAGGTPTTQPK